MPSTVDARSITNIATKPVLFISTGLILLGVLCLAAPRASGMTLGVMVGIFLFLSGLLRVAFAWVAVSWGSVFLRFMLGGLSIVAGGVMIGQPATGLQAITVVAIVYFVVDGVSQILLALRLPPATGGIWVLLGGALSLALGVMIWREWPIAGENAVGILIGVKLIIDGTVMAAVATAIRAMGKVLSS